MIATTQRSAVKTLADIANPDGVFSIIAMDQRNTLRRMFTAVGLEGTDEELRDSKVAVARALTPYASGILFDPTYGVPAATEAGALASTCGLLVAAEPAERGTFNGEPRTHRDPAAECAMGARPGWGRGQVLRAAARRPTRRQGW